MYQQRIELYKQLEALRESKLLVYITGDRQGLETQISQEVLDFFVDHLDLIGNVPKISLYLYTRGGLTQAAWSIANLVRQFCDEFEVIAPSKAHSAGTLICLGANSIVMTKQATLGPIDPSVNTPLNPGVPGAPPQMRIPVSVEAVNGFTELAKTLGVESSKDMAAVLSTLASHVHPLVLGEVYRTRAQIRMLGKRLLSNHMKNAKKIEKILAFLCSESGSHDYMIQRQEARDDLGLNVKTPTDEEYGVIKKIYTDIASELQLTEPYNPNALFGDKDLVPYEFRRALIESASGGSQCFVSVGQLSKRHIQDPTGNVQDIINDLRTFEGWKNDLAQTANA